MHFGIYLVQKNVIDADQFVMALKQQLDEVVPLGQLAMRLGILTMRDVFAIMRSQSDIPPYRFGEMAVNMEAMSSDQLAHLLMQQADSKRPLSEILVDQEVLSKHEVMEEMSAFRRNRERSGPAGTSAGQGERKPQMVARA